MDTRLERWITQSVYKYFVDNSTYHVFLEGEYRDTNTVDNCIEVRTDGPWYTIYNDRFKIELQINIVITAKLLNDLLIVDRMLGETRNIMDTNMAICRYGTDNDEDSSVVACLELIKGRHGDIIINRFGQIDKDMKIVQATIEGHYKAEVLLTA